MIKLEYFIMQNSESVVSQTVVIIDIFAKILKNPASRPAKLDSLPP